MKSHIFPQKSPKPVYNLRNPKDIKNKQPAQQDFQNLLVN